MTLELPRWLLADRLTLALIAAGALALEATLARYPGLPQGPGLLLGGLLATWQWHRARHRPRLVCLGPADIFVQTGGAGSTAPATGPRTRLLGRSVILHWRADGRSRTAWLTTADLPGEALRRMRVCCRTHRRAADQ